MEKLDTIHYNDGCIDRDIDVYKFENLTEFNQFCYEHGFNNGGSRNEFTPEPKESDEIHESNPILLLPRIENGIKIYVDTDWCAVLRPEWKTARIIRKYKYAHFTKAESAELEKEFDKTGLRYK